LIFINILVKNITHTKLHCVVNCAPRTVRK